MCQPHTNNGDEYSNKVEWAQLPHPGPLRWTIREYTPSWLISHLRRLAALPPAPPTRGAGTGAGDRSRALGLVCLPLLDELLHSLHRHLNVVGRLLLFDVRRPGLPSSLRCPCRNFSSCSSTTGLLRRCWGIRGTRRNPSSGPAFRSCRATEFVATCTSSRSRSFAIPMLILVSVEVHNGAINRISAHRASSAASGAVDSPCPNT